MFRRIRSAVTGRYVATGDPATTVTEATAPRIPAASLGRRLASYADKGSGTDMPGEAYDQDPDFWNLEAAQLLNWLR